MADYPPWLAYDANDPTETLAASDFRTAKALFVPSLMRDIVLSIACSQPPAGGVAWQSTSDGENSYSHWAAQPSRGHSRLARSSAYGADRDDMSLHVYDLAFC
jgi:hypothetical protein